MKNPLQTTVVAIVVGLGLTGTAQAVTLYQYNFDGGSILNTGTASDGDLTPFDASGANGTNSPAFVTSKTDNNGVTRTDLYDFSVGGNERSYFFSDIANQTLGSYTVGLWAWTDNLTPPSQFSSVFMNDTFQINNTAGDYRFRGSNQLIGQVLNDTWQFITVTFDGSDTKFYLDGVLTNTIAGNIGNPFNEIGIGTNRARGNSGRFLGMIDDVFIDDTAFSSTQIQTLYNEGVGIIVPEPTTVLALLTFSSLGISLKHKHKK
jgi:hypothetical protein